MEIDTLEWMQIGGMTRTLVVTNDFPPRPGGIQAFVHSLASRLPSDEVIVYAPAWRGAADFDAAQGFPVVRHPTSLMLPVLQAPYPIAQKCRPQYRFRRCGYSCCNIRDVRPLNRFTKSDSDFDGGYSMCIWT